MSLFTPRKEAVSDPEQQLYAPTPRNRDGPKAGTGQIVMSALFMLLAIICICFGWWRMYSYDEFTDKIVGGDAYNYAILATRGTGIITAGVGFAVIAVIFALLAIGEKLDER